MKEQLQPNFIKRNLDDVIRATAGIVALATGLYAGIVLNEVVNPKPRPEPFELRLGSTCITDEKLRVAMLDVTSNSSAVFELSCVESDALPAAQSRPFGIERIVDNLDPEITEISRPPENSLIDEYTLKIAGRVTPESYIGVSDKQDDESSDVRSFELYVSADEHLTIEAYQVLGQDGQVIQGVYSGSGYNTPQSATEEQE